MPRPPNTEERRQQIAQGLLKVMARKGYEGATIADVAAAAGLTTGLVHYHFENKLEILLSVLEQLVARHEANLDEVLKEAGGDPIQEVAAFIDVHLSLGPTADPDALACWITLSGEAIRQAKVRKAYEKSITSLTGRLEDIIRRGAAAGLFRSADPGAAATALVAAIQGYYAIAATARTLIPRGSAAPSVRSMAAGLLSPARPMSPGRRKS